MNIPIMMHHKVRRLRAVAPCPDDFCRVVSTFGLILAFAAHSFSQVKTETPLQGKNRTAVGTTRPFLYEAMVDFPDDALTCGRVLTPSDIEAMMVRLAELGIRRVSWGYYGDGHGGWLVPDGLTPDGHAPWSNYAATYRQLGNPLKVAVEAGHRHGLEVYAYFHPFEAGAGMMFPGEGPQAKEFGLLDGIGCKLGWMERFVVDNPNLRIKRRTDDIPAWGATAAVRSIRLTKKDAEPTRMTKDHIQIWTSPNNSHYQPSAAKFTFKESVEPAPRDARDQRGNLVMRKRDPVRVLTLSGLNLEDKYILVTTDFTVGFAGKGPAKQPNSSGWESSQFYPKTDGGDFINSGLAIMTALDGQGREIPGSFATGGTVWNANLVDFRSGGLMFDYGWGAAAVSLDAPNTNGKEGFIAFTRGRPEYLPAALCETEPRVQKFWFDCLDEMIAGGVDGVDFREESHSTHTDHPADYGFNPIVLEKAKDRKGDLLANIAEVRGEAYTEFLRECQRRLHEAGKRLRYNLQLDFFRPDPPSNRLLAYPANLRFDWQRWVDEGLMDEAVMRFFALPPTAVFEDSIAQDMITRCGKQGIPITFNRYVGNPAENLSALVRRVKSDGRFSGFIFYETSGYLKFGAKPGQCQLSYRPVLDAIKATR